MSDYITKALLVTSEVYVPAIHMNSSVFIGQVRIFFHANLHILNRVLKGYF